MSLRPCLSPALQLPRIILSHALQFHTTSTWRAEITNHYETLGLEPSASPGDIKKQFYSLSKTHHPDHNLNDPEASSRFVKISEAYAILGSPQKRSRYDQDTQRAQAVRSRTTPRGSHSSSSTPFGSRPASGLSRRRTQFKGPPPSFYRSGGWGAHGEKRQSQADGIGAVNTGGSRGGGYGYGQGQVDWTVPHFDREGHHRTQEQQDRRRQRRIQEESVDYYEGGSVLLKFIFITAVVTFAMSIPTMLETSVRRPKQKDEPW